MTEKEQFPSHKQILSDLLQGRINTKTITEYLSLLDDLYYNLPGKVYPDWISNCDYLRIEGAKNSFEAQLIVNLADELLPIIKDKEMGGCSVERLIHRFNHIDSNLVRLSLFYLKDQGKIGISSSGMIQYILTLEDRKKLLIDKITSGNKEMIYALEDSLEQYLEKLSEDIPF